MPEGGRTIVGGRAARSADRGAGRAERHGADGKDAPGSVARADSVPRRSRAVARIGGPTRATVAYSVKPTFSICSDKVGVIAEPVTLVVIR